eukprot:GHVN01016911.1.p1 GENE.GHVN01016911.1~~GHVN01016911.1.p1  ORF type:complete len:152 (-),score=18.40 GHVN01016911.1:409-864(-)
MKVTGDSIVPVFRMQMRLNVMISNTGEYGRRQISMNHVWGICRRLRDMNIIHLVPFVPFETVVTITESAPTSATPGGRKRKRRALIDDVDENGPSLASTGPQVSRSGNRAKLVPSESLDDEGGDVGLGFSVEVEEVVEGLKRDESLRRYLT